MGIDLSAIKNVEGYMGYVHLDALEKHIIRLRNGLPYEPMTLDQIARIFGFSRERIRQIENEVMERIRKSMKFKDSRRKLEDFLHVPE